MDKPYLEPNHTIAFLIEWGGTILFIALVLSPFAFLLLRRFRPTRWYHILGAYVSMIAIFLLIEWPANGIHRWMLDNYINTGWVSNAWSAATLREWITLTFVWPFLPFYSTKLLYGRFTWKRFFITLLVSIILTIIFLAIVAYVVAWGVGQAFMEHF